MIEINIVDFTVYFIGLFCIAGLLPDEYKEEIGGLVGGVILGVYTVAYIIVFGFFYDFHIVST